MSRLARLETFTNVLGCVVLSGMQLRAHQQAAVESESRVVVLCGDSCTGKTFTVAPWLVTLEPGKLHAMVALTFPVATVDLLMTALRALYKTDIESVFGRKPPAAWNAKLPEGVTSWRNVLTLSTGATILVTSQSSQIRGRRFASVFIDTASVDEPVSTIVDIVNHSERAIVTTYGAMAGAIPDAEVITARRLAA